MKLIETDRQLSWLDMAISRPKTWSHWRKKVLLVIPVGYFDWPVCVYRFLGPLGTKNGGKLGKKPKKWFFQVFMVTLSCEKFDLKARFWFSLGPWWSIGICKFVSECLFGFSRQLEGSKLSSTKIWHFCPDIHKVNGALDGEAGCHP